MRKVKYCQTTFNEKFSKILEQFPKIDDIHPFYADLCNVLYDRDHYKLALGQVNAVRGIIDNIGKDYCKLLKFADTRYKCKMLKRAAMGRMCTSAKKLQNSLVYLEEVRQHLARLPAINPSTRTVLITGYPNVGKSSFMNILSNAQVDVQPYAFTTKSLFVGHFDYEYCRWQVIDTPGILDHPLEERNTIEMTAITALAHIQSVILFFVDISENCGWTIAQQVSLFHSIKPLFKGKPLMAVLNKTDLRSVDDLTEVEKECLKTLKDEASDMMDMSCATKAGIDAVKNKSCELLMEKRVETKIKQNKTDNIANRIFMTNVAPPANRPAFIPPAVAAARAKAEASGDLSHLEEAKGTKETEKDLQEKNGGAGVYSVDLRKTFILKKEEWRYDNVPEIMDGMNVADFIDEDIEAKLLELEKEEDLLLQASKPTAEEIAEEAKWVEAQKSLRGLHSRMEQKRLENRLRHNSTHLPTPRVATQGLSEVEEKLEKIGKPTEGVRARTLERGRSLKRKRDESEMEEAILRSKSKHRSKTPSRLVQGLPEPKMRAKVESVKRKKMRMLSVDARKGEGDRHIPDFKPKHLFSGKRGKGKTDRR